MPHPTTSQHLITEENESDEQVTTSSYVAGESDYLGQKACDETASSASGTVYSNGTLGTNNGATSGITNDGSSGNSSSNASVVVVTPDGNLSQLVVPPLAAQIISSLQQQVSILKVELEHMKRLATPLNIPVVRVMHPVTVGGNLSASSHASDSSNNNIVQQKRDGITNPTSQKTTAVTPNDALEFKGERKGRWTPLEHKLFVKGLLRYGRRWKMISTLVKTRSYPQIKGHAQKYFHKLAKISGKSEKEICGEDFSNLVMAVEEMDCEDHMGFRMHLHMKKKECLKSIPKKRDIPSTSTDVNGMSTNPAPDNDITTAAIELTRISEGGKSAEKSSQPIKNRQWL